MSGREALTAPCPVHPACGCAPASPLPCTCPPLTPGLRERIEAAAAREALPSVEEMTAALEAALMWTDEETHESIARGSVEDVAERVLAALRAARASDGVR